MKRSFALLLLLCIALALAACGSSERPVGNWTAQVMLFEIAGDDLYDMAEMAPALADLTVDIDLALRGDETFLLTVDGSSSEATVNEALRAYLDEKMGEMGLTAEEYEEITGKPLETVMDEFSQNVNLEELVMIKGSYTQEGTTLILTAEDGSIYYGTWEGDTLRLDMSGYGQLSFTRR